MVQQCVVAEDLIDTDVPQTARIWNYLLGGTDNYPVDRAVGDQITATLPHFGEHARLSRKFHGRVVRHLVREAGLRQFLDVGTGLPTAGNTHQVAQAAAPESRIVYVDSDPLVKVHADQLLTSTPEGATDFLHADLRDPDAILRGAGRTLDLEKPVGVLLMGILGHVESDDEARQLIAGLLDPLPVGSCFAMYDGGDTSADVREASRIWNESANPKYHLRSPERIAALFAGLELVEPGVVTVTRWHPDADAPEIDQFGAVGRKVTV